MSKKNWKAKNRRTHLEQVVNRYNILDTCNNDFIDEENVTFEEVKEKLGRLWEDDITWNPDAHYVFAQLKKPNISLDKVQDMLMGVGYYAEVIDNDA